MMDYQAFVDSVNFACCVLSVGKTPDGGCGEIRILWANQPYRDTMGPAYHYGMLYHELVPKDNKFEDYCYRAAILGQWMHAYVETKALGGWTDQTIIPLQSDRDDLGYCQFIFKFTKDAEADRMAAVSAGAADTVIRSCIALMGCEDFKAHVEEVLDIVLQDAGAKTCRIMLFDHRARSAYVFCERRAPDAKPPRRETEEIDYDLMLTWEKLIGVSNAVIIKDERDMESIAQSNPAWAAAMRGAGLQSMVLIPLRGGKNVLGYLYVVNFNVEKVVEVKETLELLSFFLGAEIYNHQLMDRLERISSIDALTGVRNRRAMIRRMKELSVSQNRKPFGVVNIDLNGLKRTNDQQGHDAGDRFLVQTGELLRKVFYEDDIFRTGGDEFIVIMADVDEETFSRKVRRLREDMQKHSDVSFAIGECWSDDAEDIRTVFHRADDRMYADKQDFYEKNPHISGRPRMG